MRTKQNQRLFFSGLVSILLHLILIGTIIAFKPPTLKQEKKVRLENLLVLKRGQSQDPTKNKEGSKKPSLAAPKNQPSAIPTPLSNPTTTAAKTPPKKQEQKQKDSHKKALEKFDPTPFNAKDLSLLEPSFLPQQSGGTYTSKQTDKGNDSETIQEINQLYGEEFGDLGTAQKDFIRNNLRNIGRITQSYLSYPRIAAYFEQSGVNAVEFYLHPNGDISGLKIIKSSGLSSFDAQTLHTIKIAYKDYPRPTETTLIRIHVTYSYYGY